MKLSLSVRIVEAACKTKLHIPFEELVEIAASTGYDAVCLRASAGGVQTPQPRLEEMSAAVAAAGLDVSMVTADFDVPLNNERGPDSLRDITPSLVVAQVFDCDLIRVCLKVDEDVEFAKRANELASDRGVRLAHQCHTSSLFEELDRIEQLVEEIGSGNFGIIYEPANLMLCDQPYDLTALERLRPMLMNVYVQNHRLDPDGPDGLPTYCRGEVRFHHLPIWEKGGVDFDSVFAGLKAIDYDKYFTIHQAEGIETADDARQYAKRCAEFVRSQI